MNYDPDTLPYIGHKFYGALAYADDLVLLSPSVKALQEMINLCEIFGTEYSLQFNERKTECIRFGENIKANPPIYICLDLSYSGKHK